MVTRSGLCRGTLYGSVSAISDRFGRWPSSPASLAQPRPRHIGRTYEVGIGAAIRNHDAVEVALVALVFSASLFNSQVGPLSPLAVMALIPAYGWLRYERVLPLLVRCWPVLLLPGFALLSAAWSISPGDTLRYGTLYGATAIAGVIFGGGMRRTPLLIGLFLAFAIYNLGAFAFGHSVAWGGGNMGSQAFSGLSGGKNQSGDIAALGMIIGVATAVLAVTRRRPLLLALVLGAMGPTMWILWMSHATGSLIAGAGASLCLLLWSSSQLLPREWRTAIFMVVALVVVVAMATQSVWTQPLFDFVLKSSGKDAGLTGRAFIWNRADMLIHERPWLGLGYGAFWVPGNLDAEAIWRFAGIAGKSGFNFHNTGREILVALGWSGLLLFVGVLVIGFVSLLIRAMVTPDQTIIMFCAFVVYYGMRFGVEALGFVPINYGAILIYATCAMGYAAVPDRPRTLVGHGGSRRPVGSY